MGIRGVIERTQQPGTGESPYWFARLSKPVLFLVITMALLGAYLAFTIPIAVFPSTNFPRVVIGVDNGVMPIDQMMVTITRPVEEAVQQRSGIAAGTLDYQPGIGGNRLVLQLECGHGARRCNWWTRRSAGCNPRCRRRRSSPPTGSPSPVFPSSGTASLPTRFRKLSCGRWRLTILSRG